MLPLPQRIGKFEIRGKLGEGRMGVVYLAYDAVLEREVALKVMASSIESNEELRERFLQEAKAIARLANHPNIVSINDLGYDEQGAPYIAMERLHGRDLDWRLRHDPPKFAEKLEIVIQVLKGLAKAHEKGIVHRDIKPANIFITDSGTVKIMDFGVARLTDHSQTSTGVILGTAYYMSPEQIRASKAMDGRSDIFSVGVILFRLLTGKNPFEADNVEAIFFKILRADVPALALDGRRVPELQRIVDRALAKNPDDRYPDADSMARDLQVILNKYRGVVPDTICFETVDRQSPAPDPVPPPRPRPRRPPPEPVPRSLPRAAMLLVGLGVTLGLAYYSFVNGPSDDDTTTTLVESERPEPTSTVPDDSLVSSTPEPEQEPSDEPPPPTEVAVEEESTVEGSNAAAATTLITEVLTALSDGEFDLADSLIAKGKSLYPTAGDWDSLRERLGRARRETAVQEELRQKAAEVASFLDEASHFMSAEKYLEAIAVFQRVLEFDPDNLVAQTGIASAKKLIDAANQPDAPLASFREIKASVTMHTPPSSRSGGFGPGGTKITEAARLAADLLIELEPANARSGDRYTLTIRLVNNSNSVLVAQELEIVSTFGQLAPIGIGKRIPAHSPKVDPHSMGILYQMEDTWTERMNQGRIVVTVYLAQRGSLQKSIHWT